MKKRSKHLCYLERNYVLESTGTKELNCNTTPLSLYHVQLPVDEDSRISCRVISVCYSNRLWIREVERRYSEKSGKIREVMGQLQVQKGVTR
jgi:hypothetical protein